MDSTHVTIETDDDWQKFEEKKLYIIPDSMIFRTAEVFLAGKKGLSSDQISDEVWNSIASNLESLETFFSQLIFSEHIPIIDYNLSYGKIGYNIPAIKERVNEKGEILYSVHVDGAAADEALERASKPIVENYTKLNPGLKVTALKQLSAFDYKWKPYIKDLNVKDFSEDDLKIQRFIFGGQLFSEYARKAKVAHLIQRSREELSLALSIGSQSKKSQSKKSQSEERILTVAKKILQEQEKVDSVKDSDFKLRWPPVLPYLLYSNPKPKTPDGILKKALKVRLAQFGEFRSYLNEYLISVNKPEMMLDNKTFGELTRIFQHIKMELKKGVDKSDSFYDLQYSINDPDVIIAKLKNYGLFQPKGLRRADRYIMLLSQLKLSATISVDLEKKLKCIWENERRIFPIVISF